MTTSSHFLDPGDLSQYSDSVLAYGHFDTIHAGHIRYLKHAKTLADTLIVAVQGDFDDNQNRNFQI